MSRGSTLLLVAAMLAGCGGDGGFPPGEPIPAVDRQTTLSASSEEVALGQGFPLVVRRVFRKVVGLPDWSDDFLAPLVVRPQSTLRREDELRVEEWRRYRAYAFAPGELTVSHPSLDGEPLVVRVRSGLDPDDPGPVELPGEPLFEPFPWGLVGAGGGAAIVLVLLLAASRRRSSRLAAGLVEPAADVPPPEPGPHERALDRIERLRRAKPSGPEEIRAFHVEAAKVLRDYLAESFSVRAAETTEECLARPEPFRDLLGEALLPSDLVKFASLLSDEAEREEVLDASERFVRETAPREAVR